MRFGYWSIGSVMFLIFLVIINSGQMDEVEMEEVFLKIDGDINAIGLDNPDANFGKFINHTLSGVSQEFHGGYYLARWLNTFLPDWVIQNLELLIVLFIVAVAAPAIFYGFLLVVAVCMMVKEARDRAKKRRDESDSASHG